MKCCAGHLWQPEILGGGIFLVSPGQSMYHKSLFLTGGEGLRRGEKHPGVCHRVFRVTSPDQFWDISSAPAGSVLCVAENVKVEARKIFYRHVTAHIVACPPDQTYYLCYAVCKAERPPVPVVSKQQHIHLPVSQI